MLTAASDMLVIANEGKAADALVIPFPELRNNSPQVEPQLLDESFLI